MVYALSLLQGITTVDRPAHAAELLRRDGRGPRSPERREPEQRRHDRDQDRRPGAGRRLIAGVGLSWCFFLNAVSYLGVIAALLAMRVVELRPQRAPREAGAIREGLRYAWRTGELRRPLLLMSVLYLFTFNYSVLMPLFAERTFHGDAGTLALLFSVAGVGSLAGALVHGRSPETRGTSAGGGGGRRGHRDDARRARADPRRRRGRDAAARRRVDRVLRDGQLDAAAHLAARDAWARHGAVRDRVPRDHAVRRPDRGWVGEHLGPRFAFAAGGSSRS